MSKREAQIDLRTSIPLRKEKKNVMKTQTIKCSYGMFLPFQANLSGNLCYSPVPCLDMN